MVSCSDVGVPAVWRRGRARVTRARSGTGLPVCEPFGHVGCGASSDLLSWFGDRDNPQWTASVCTTDSDGDGHTNGDELGDPCCVWAAGGGPPARTTDVSHPGYATSVTKAASCTSSAPPAISGLAAGVDPATGALVVSWAAVAPNDGCVCSFKITTPTGTVTVAPSATSYMLCGVSPSETVSVRAVNSKGVGGKSALSLRSLVVCRR